MLCTTRVYVGTHLYCEPRFTCSLSTTKILYYASVPLCTICVCSLSTYLEKVPSYTILFWCLVPHQIQTKSVRFVHVEKCWGRTLLCTDIAPPCAPWCITQIEGAQHGPVPLYPDECTYRQGWHIGWIAADIGYPIISFSRYPISNIFNCPLSTDIRYLTPADIRYFNFADIRYLIFPGLQFVTDTISDIKKKNYIYRYPIYRKTNMPSLLTDTQTQHSYSCWPYSNWKIRQIHTVKKTELNVVGLTDY